MLNEVFMLYLVVLKCVGVILYILIIFFFFCVIFCVIFYCLEFVMRWEFVIEFFCVIELVVLVGYKWLGCGDKNIVDGVVVNVMCIMFNQVNIDGIIVIGEGEIDEVLMFYIGEKVGIGCGDVVDIVVDLIEGMCMMVMGQVNVLVVLVVGDKGCFFNVLDMYMEKLIVGLGVKGIIDLNLLLVDNLCNVVVVFGKLLSELMVMILVKLCYDVVIVEM